MSPFAPDLGKHERSTRAGVLEHTVTGGRRLFVPMVASTVNAPAGYVPAECKKGHHLKTKTLKEISRPDERVQRGAGKSGDDFHSYRLARVKKIMN